LPENFSFSFCKTEKFAKKKPNKLHALGRTVAAAVWRIFWHSSFDWKAMSKPLEYSVVLFHEIPVICFEGFDLAGKQQNILRFYVTNIPNNNIT